MAFKLLVLFFVTAVTGYLLGKWIDVYFDVKPYGSIISFLIFFALSWVIVIRIYMDMMKEIREKLKEAEEMEAKEEANNKIKQ